MTSTSPTHNHDFLGAAHDRHAKATWAVVALTLVTMVAEITAGVIFDSMALLADGIHMATHAGALGLAALAYRYAKRHTGNPRYSFGTGKVGDLAGFASAMILGVAAVGVIVESISHLINPAPVQFGPALVVAVIGLIVNLISALLLGQDHHHGPRHHHDHDHDHDHDHGHAHHHPRPSELHADHNHRSAFMHVVADALTSVLAIAGLAAGAWWGLNWLDPLIGVMGGVIILIWSFGLIRDTARVLLDEADPALAEEMRRLVEGPGDAVVIDLHVWRVGPGALAAIVSSKGLADAQAVRQRLKDVPALAHLTVEIHQP